MILIICLEWSEKNAQSSESEKLPKSKCTLLNLATDVMYFTLNAVEVKIIAMRVVYTMHLKLIANWLYYENKCPLINLFKQLVSIYLIHL